MQRMLWDKRGEQINHFGDCSIYALGCDICDCGKFSRLMPSIDKVDEETMKLLVAHQVQVRELVYGER